MFFTIIYIYIYGIDKENHHFRLSSSNQSPSLSLYTAAVLFDQTCRTMASPPSTRARGTVMRTRHLMPVASQLLPAVQEAVEEAAEDPMDGMWDEHLEAMWKEMSKEELEEEA